MMWRFTGIGRTGFTCLLAVATLFGPASAQAQYAASCPTPKKLAAGACVTVCPAGYEDQGRVCVYRNLSR